jgi:hypothetical protein
MFLTCFSYFVATFSIFAKSLLTSFLAQVLRTCAPMFLEQNTRVSHFFSQKILELTLSCVSQATQYSPSRNQRGYPTREKKLTVACL